MNTAVKGIDVAGCSRSVDVSYTNKIGIRSLEEMSLISTSMVLYRKGPVLITATKK